MTQIKVDNIADAAGTGAPDFEDGLTVAGSAISTLNTAEYYESGTEPSSPKNGALWKDTANDKLMMYVAGEFKEIELGASAGGGWTVDISGASYDSVSFDLGSSAYANVQSVTFNSDGTKMYTCGRTTDRVFQYTLSTAFDLSTASYNSVFFDPSSQEDNPTSIAFNTDGTKLYVAGYGNDGVYEYSLSTAFDLSTASYNNNSFSFSSQDTSPQSISFNSDGTKMFMQGIASNSVHQYSLSTGFDVSTASYDSVSVSVQNSSGGLSFNPDGTRFYLICSIFGSNAVHQYSLSTGFDLSTASYDSVSFSTEAQTSGPDGIAFSSDGTKMYIADDGENKIYQYSTGL